VLVHLRTAADLDGQLDQAAHDQAGQVAERLVVDDVDAVDVPGQRADGVPGLHAGQDVADAGVDALPEGDVPLGGMTVVAIDRERIMLANVAGRFYAMRDMCGHRNAPLSRGKLDGCIVECPLHFAQFDVRTGKLVDGPISADVPIYEVRVEGDTVMIKR